MSQEGGKSNKNFDYRIVEFDGDAEEFIKSKQHYLVLLT